MKSSNPTIDANSHMKFKDLAVKSIGSSVSVPFMPKKLKNPYGEAKFKVSVDKRITALYFQLMQNRVAKLKKAEELEKKNLEIQEKIKNDKLEKKKRKAQDQENHKELEEHKKKEIDHIKEQIKSSRTEHQSIMNDIKKQSSTYRLNLNKQRKNEKINHQRIKSLFIETAREINAKKAQVIKISIEKIESSRAESMKNFKSNLRKEYLARIEQDRLEKLEYENKMKELESEEIVLLQRLGKSYSTTIQSIQN